MNYVTKGQNLSTIAKNAGMTPAQFATLNPHLAGSGAGTYKGLKNTVSIGTGYNLSNPNATVVTPSSTTPVVTTATGAKYSRTANKTDKAIQSVYDKLDSYNTAPDLASITAGKRANAQAVIDSVNAQFAGVIAGQRKENAGMNDRVRASNITSGLAGSDFGTANAIGQEQKGQKAIDMIENEKAAKVNAILTGIDTGASEEYQRQRAEYVKGLGDNLDRLREFRKEEKEQAINNIKNLAQMNVSLEKVKSAEPDAYKSLLEQTGGSEMDLEGIWNDSLPDNMKVKYEQKIIQGKNGKATVLRYGLDPQTGTVSTKEYDLGVDYNTLTGAKPVNVGGRLYAMTTDADGNEIAKPLTSFATKSTTPKTVKFSQSTIDAFGKQIDATKGKDTFVDPYVYKQAYDAWTSEGGDQASFVKSFPPNKYVNPVFKNAQVLPTALQSTVKPAKSSTARPPIKKKKKASVPETK